MVILNFSLVFFLQGWPYFIFTYKNNGSFSRHKLAGAICLKDRNKICPLISEFGILATFLKFSEKYGCVIYSR